MISTWPFSVSTCPNRLLSGLLLLLILFPASAAAQERPLFKSKSGKKSAQIIDFVQNLDPKNHISYDVAAIDLNDDFLDEYIVRPAAQHCHQGTLCQYQIVALQDRKPILIGQFDAHKILISDKKSYGIRGLIVYNIPRNDFKHAFALWDPFSFRYTLR